MSAASNVAEKRDVTKKRIRPRIYKNLANEQLSDSEREADATAHPERRAGPLDAVP